MDYAWLFSAGCEIGTDQTDMQLYAKQAMRKSNAHNEWKIQSI